MANLNLKSAEIYKAVFCDKIIFFRKATLFKRIFIALFLVSFIILIFNTYAVYFGIDYTIGSFSFFASLFFASFSLFLLFFQIDLFFNNFLKKPKLLMEITDAAENIDKINIADYLAFDLAKIIEKVLNKGGADSYLLLYFLLQDKDIDFIFYRALLDRKQAINELKTIFEERGDMKEEGYSECLKKTINDSLLVAAKRGSERITRGDLFIALSEHNRYLKETFYRTGVRKEDIVDLVSWRDRLLEKEDPLLYKNLIKKGRIGIEWASGHTPFLDKFSIDWTSKIKHEGFPETVGHEKEADSLERALSRNEINSVILVGEPGAGRKSIVRKIARKSFLGEGLPEINHHRFIEVDIPSLLAQADGIEETEQFLDKLFHEATVAGNIILIINNFHSYIGVEQRPGVVDITGVLNSYLNLPQFRVIGITSYIGYRQNIEKNPTASSLLEKIEVKEATKEDTLILLERTALSLENKYKKLISFTAIKRAISLAERYMQNAPFPEKAIDLLEEAVVHINQHREDLLLPEHVDKIVSERTEVPVGEVDEQEKNVLLNLESLLHERMVNQETAVKAVSYALRRSRADIDTRKGLIGSFLFLGPTGVGKTEMSKAIAAVYFGNEKKTIRIDMSEFQSISDIHRLIGSSDQEGVLTSKVREDPFSLILLDELEKAHKDILNLFLQILDEGHLTDGLGRKVNFENCMVIATSNAGYQIILESAEKGTDWGEVKNKILKRIFQQGIFRPEFVNRFDDVILFEPLTKENLVDIVGLQLDKMVKGLEEREIKLVVTEELKEKIVEISYDPTFGAREMQRAIQNNIGDVLSSAILKGELNKGDTFSIDHRDFSLIKR